MGRLTLSLCAGECLVSVGSSQLGSTGLTPFNYGNYTLISADHNSSKRVIHVLCHSNIMGILARQVTAWRVFIICHTFFMH